MIELIQDWIWNIGGFLATIGAILFILLLFVLLFIWVTDRILMLSCWRTKSQRENIVYWMKHKKRINEIIDEEKKDDKNRK